MADNHPDNHPDNLAVTELDHPDNLVETPDFEKFSIAKLKEKYSVKQDALYKRLNYLQITTHKYMGKAYLDADQITQMDGLHEYIQKHRTMEGYPVPEPSGPAEEQPGGKLAKAESSDLIEVETETQQLKAESQSTAKTDVNPIIVSAQNMAAGVLMAERILAKQYIENPDLLPQHLQEQIQQVGEVGPVDPLEYANKLVNLARGAGGG
ncbi:hypothetical protein Cylst_5188 [Cylindrospermum stagnale PCC 7417]|uniref:Uncharacterized protein n=1 Tax=Cylindrospermum stagnale PCC 7417 TaxID=56107 RepID=K9X6G1_9NOST|nr:hypothetical protein [Cylindrospermum stagnale]AFZ27227.1 hypothetical protein Cylst_5188 [Cylindrospermum stagnale PCC 7417]